MKLIHLDLPSQLNSPAVFSCVFSYPVLFLFLKCGEENDFMSSYYKVITSSKINVIAIYDSPTCLFTLNSAWSLLNVSGDLAASYSYLNRLVSVDTSMLNYATNSIQVQLPNPTSVNQVSCNQRCYVVSCTSVNSGALFFRVSKASFFLNELEDFYFLQAYDGSSSSVYLSQLNENISFNCLVDGVLMTNDTFQYCRRSLSFYLLNSNTQPNLTSPLAIITLSDLYNSTSWLLSNIDIYNGFTLTPMTRSSNVASSFTIFIFRTLNLGAFFTDLWLTLRLGHLQRRSFRGHWFDNCHRDRLHSHLHHKVR